MPVLFLELMGLKQGGGGVASERHIPDLAWERHTPSFRCLFFPCHPCRLLSCKSGPHSPIAPCSQGSPSFLKAPPDLSLWLSLPFVSEDLLVTSVPPAETGHGGTAPLKSVPAFLHQGQQDLSAEGAQLNAQNHQKALACSRALNRNLHLRNGARASLSWVVHTEARRPQGSVCA